MRRNPEKSCKSCLFLTGHSARHEDASFQSCHLLKDAQQALRAVIAAPLGLDRG
jgi:hypothetical protein